MLHNPASLLNGHPEAMAPNIVAALMERMKSNSGDWRGGAKIADDYGYVSKNGQRVYPVEPTDYVIQIARLQDQAWIQFSKKFEHKITNHGHYDRSAKYAMAIDEAISMTPGDIKEFLHALTGSAIGQAVLIFGLVVGISG